MRYIASILVILLAICFSSAHAQDKGMNNSVFSDYLNGSANGGFISIPGLQFKSSMGFSYYSSGGNSMSMGYYMGHFNYEFGEAWNLNVGVGVRSQLDTQVAGNSPELFIPNIDLTYRPSKKFMLHFHFRQYNYPMSRRMLR